MGTYLQEGPNSQMKEEEFYDAVDAGLDRLDEKFDEMMVWMLPDLFIYSIFVECTKNTVDTIHIKWVSYELLCIISDREGFSCLTSFQDIPESTPSII